VQIVRNRPAERLRHDVFDAWKLTAARNWLIFPVIASVAALYILFLALVPTTSWWRGFCSGVFVGSASVAIVWLIHLFSGSHNALFGTLGEQATAEVLQSRRMKRAGWQVVNGLGFAGHGDVDHSLVGPGGLFAVESKWTNQPWRLGPGGQCEPLNRALIQARLGARKIKSALRSHHVAGERAVCPVVVIWGPGAPTIAGGFAELNGVVVVEGRKLRHWTDGLRECNLDGHDIDDAYRALLAELSGRVAKVNRPESVASR